MNRYVAEGIIHDARSGSRVIVVSASVTASHAAFSEIACRLSRDEASEIRRGEHIKLGGGRIGFVSAQAPGALRSKVADIVFIDGETADARVNHDDVAAVLAAGNIPELIRA